MGFVPGMIGLLGAVEAIKLLLGLGNPLVGRLLRYEALAGSFVERTVLPDPACPCCGEMRPTRSHRWSPPVCQTLNR
jgi:molybdopterin/thiamine biosynthesis adenylyltransferase